MTGRQTLGPTWYEATGTAAPDRSSLCSDTSADVCIVGGGFAGLSAALHLAKAGLNTVLLEAEKVGSGASGRNGGQIHSGQREDQTVLERELGPERARAFWALAEDAKSLVRALVADHAIDCDLKTGLIYAAWKRRDAEALRDFVRHMAETYAYPTTWIEKSRVGDHVATDRYFGLVVDPGGGQLHPLNFARGLARAAEAAGATIHEASRVTALERSHGGVVVKTEQGSVRAGHAVLACDTWLGDLDAAAGRTAIAINSFIGVTEPLGAERAQALIPSDMAIADTKFVVDYYRLTPHRRLLFGGGETYSPRYPADLRPIVRNPMLKVFPQLADVKLDHVWGGPVGITLSRMPHFGWSDARTVFAHGFSGQGVAIATLAGKLMAEAVSGAASRFDLFAGLKHRPIPGGRMFRAPLTALGMAWYALKDRL